MTHVPAECPLNRHLHPDNRGKVPLCENCIGHDKEMDDMRLELQEANENVEKMAIRGKELIAELDTLKAERERYVRERVDIGIRYDLHMASCDANAERARCEGMVLHRADMMAEALAANPTNKELRWAENTTRRLGAAIAALAPRGAAVPAEYPPCIDCGEPAGSPNGRCRDCDITWYMTPETPPVPGPETRETPHAFVASHIRDVCCIINGDGKMCRLHPFHPIHRQSHRFILDSRDINIDERQQRCAVTGCTQRKFDPVHEAHHQED